MIFCLIFGGGILWGIIGGLFGYTGDELNESWANFLHEIWHWVTLISELLLMVVYFAGVFIVWLLSMAIPLLVLAAVVIFAIWVSRRMRII
jgi:hypothetical protein